MQRVLKSPFLLVIGIAALVLLLPPLLPSTFYVRVVALVFINALAVLGLNLLMGFAGQVSLGHAGFFGIGAYAVAVGPTHLGLPVWLSLLVGIALAALIAFVVGRPILRLRGYYLAVATLGMGVLIAMVVQRSQHHRRSERHAGAPAGVVRLARGRTDDLVLDFRLTLVIGVWIAVNLIESPTGRAFRAIHDSETAARVLGINVARYKLLAFVLSAVYASVAGGYFVLFDGFVTPDTSSFLRSIEFVVMAVLGGLGSIFGSIVGAGILVILPQFLTVFHDYEHIVLGVIIIVFLIFLPAGIVPALASLIWRRTS